MNGPEKCRAMLHRVRPDGSAFNLTLCQGKPLTYKNLTPWLLSWDNTAMVGTLRKKIRFRFSLLTLLLVVTAFGIFMGVWSGSARRQQRAVEWVRKQGGQVIYDGLHDEGRSSSSGTGASKSGGLRGILGVDYFHKVLWVSIHNENVRDLSPLSGLKKLKLLSLEGTSVKDLSPLTGLKQLISVFLDDTPISSLSPLTKLTKLRQLHFSNTLVSDLSPLTNMASLTELHFTGTKIQDLSPLADLKNLEQLHLAGTLVNDLSPLADMKKLEMLDLRNTQVRDLSPLEGLKKLEVLYLDNNQVSEEEIEKLKKALPNLHVIH